MRTELEDVATATEPAGVERAALPAVTHVVLSLEVGGLERIVLNLVREGIERGQRVSVVCLVRRGVLAERAEELGAPVVCLGKRPGLRPGMVGEIGAVLRELRPEVVHTHQIGALLYTGPAARRAGFPIVHTEHTNSVRKEVRRWDRLRVRLLWGIAGRFASRFCCVADDAAAEAVAYRTLPKRKVLVVPNGIDTAAFQVREGAGELRESLGIGPDAPVIGTVGRLNEIKRQDLLISAFGEISGQLPEAHLVLVGDGPRMGELKELAYRSGGADRIHFVGYQSRPERYLQIMDVFSLTSRIEGMPLAILEAWAAGVPVVASRVGGVPKLVDDEENGLLFEADDLAGLTAQVLRVLENPTLAGQLARAGHKRVEANYSLRRMFYKYQGVYADVLTSRAHYP